jgi:hypothetical protein
VKLRIGRTIAGATLALTTGAILATAGPLATNTAANAETRSPVTSSPVRPNAATWVQWGTYLTHEECRHEGRDKLGGVVVAYECRWDSPYWALWLRIEA